MAHYYFGAPHQSSINSQPSFPASLSNHNHHSNRSRRSARFNGAAPNAQKQPKITRGSKDVSEDNSAMNVRRDYEAARSFDLEDDEIFCPWHLLTDDDLQSIHSSSSDRASSSGSGSPDHSPLQPQLQPTPSFAPPASAAHLSAFQPGNNSHMKIHQPLAQRTRNAIPIVDPNSRNASPPTSISPARQMHKSAYLARRW